jgi:hypothetical protein
LPAIPRDLAGEQVERDAARAEFRHGLAGLGAADEGLEAGVQLGEGEGLGEVVVAAGLQAADAVVELGAGTEDDDGQLVLLRAQGLDQRQPIELGEHEVNDGGRVVTLPGERKAIEAVGRVVHGKARLLQPAGDKGGELGIVLDDQDAHGRCRITGKHARTRVCIQTPIVRRFRWFGRRLIFNGLVEVS